MSKRKGAATTRASTRKRRTTEQIGSSSSASTVTPSSSSLPKWQWEERGVWHDYDAVTQTEINSRFQVDPKRKFKLKIGTVRYTIDLNTMTQCNDGTKFARRIRRRSDSTESATTSPGNTNDSSKSIGGVKSRATNGVWEWEEFGVFQQYLPAEQSALRAAYLNMSSVPVFKLNIFGSSYTIDFNKMTQTKDVTGFTRKIRLQQQESESESEQGDEAESRQDEVNDTQESDEGVNSTDPNAKPTMKAIQQLTKWQVIKDMEKLKQDSCSICLCEFQDEEDEVNDGKIVKLSKCGDHYFHIDCIVQAFSHKKSCPACTTRYGIETGTQPRVGTMDSRVMHGSLPGFPRSKTIIIEYNFPNGVQGPEHPNPGKRYGGTSRVAYLPDTPEGNKVLRLFKQAFKQRVMFTVGTSITTGMSDCVIWNGIHHKTSRTGGASRFGYPDGTYLQRVQQELASKGIVEE